MYYKINSILLLVKLITSTTNNKAVKVSSIINKYRATELSVALYFLLCLLKRKCDYYLM